MKGRPLTPDDHCTQRLQRRAIRVRHGRLVWYLTRGDVERGEVREDVVELEKLMRLAPEKGAA